MYEVCRSSNADARLTTHIRARTETRPREHTENFELSDQPADPLLDPEDFFSRVVELARRKFPLLDVTAEEQFHLRVGESSVNLFNFYRSYVQSPERFEEIVLPALTTVVQLQELGPDQLKPPLAQVRERIMPMLYPQSTWHSRFQQFVGIPWIAELAIVFVVDESRSYWFVGQDLFNSWDITLEELRQLALENLEAYFQANPSEVACSDGDAPRLIMPTQPDAYHAARFLSDPFRDQLRELLGSEFALGIPNRDFFVAVSLDDPLALAQVRSQVADDYLRRDHPLCSQLLLVSADGISEHADGFREDFE